MEFVFDRGDVAWLRSYCHVLMTMIDGYRAVNAQRGFAKRVKRVFPDVEADPEGLGDNANPHGLDLVAPERLKDMRLHLIAVCELNRETWKHIRAETDDELEWLPNTKQKDLMGLPLTDRRVDTWLAMMEELEALLKGETVISIPSYLGPDAFREKHPTIHLNVKKLLDDPPKDMFNMDRLNDHGIDEKYLEKAGAKKSFDLTIITRIAQLFDGPLGFAYAARLN